MKILSDRVGELTHYINLVSENSYTRQYVSISIYPNDPRYTIHSSHTKNFKVYFIDAELSNIADTLYVLYDHSCMCYLLSLKNTFHFEMAFVKKKIMLHQNYAAINFLPGLSMSCPLAKKSKYSLVLLVATDLIFQPLNTLNSMQNSMLLQADSYVLKKVGALKNVSTHELLEEIAFELMKESLNVTRTTPSISQQVAANMYRVKDYIDTNISNPQLSMKDIAAATGVSRRTITENFKKIYSSSAHDYINKVRIDLAEFMLAENDKATMEEIATDLGFRTWATFERVFKYYRHTSPEEYRADQQQKRQK